ncbi:MAG: sulfotransferase [Spirochaetes bacterium]|nr:sulfotransferase [Spirochaetota bacterium]
MKRPGRFFIIGAMRSGTTYLATILDEHPEICIAKPILPEPKFFLNDEEFSKGTENYNKKFFSHCSNEKWLGEKTVHYCEHEKAAKRISQWFPYAKIVMILRNPVYRALSNYYFTKGNGYETRTKEQVFLENFPAPDYDRTKFYISPFDYIKRGHYLDFIDLYSNYFKKDYFKILIMEKFIGRIDEIQSLYKFIGVNNEFIPDSLEKKIFSNDVDLSIIDVKIINKLKEYFSEHNRKLEKYLGISLKLWE